MDGAAPRHRFETARLCLRPFRMEDLEAAHRVLDLDQDEPGMSLSERREALAYRIAQLAWDEGVGCYAIERIEDGALIGYAGLQVHLLPATPLLGSVEGAFATPQVEVFYKLGRRARGRGYATEACQALVAFAFGTLRLERLVSVTERGNLGSVALLQRLGAEIHDHPTRPTLAIGIIRAPNAAGRG